MPLNSIKSNSERNFIDSGNKQRGPRFEKRLKDLIKIACNNNEDIPIIFYDDNPDWIEKNTKTLF